jgi:hypothetical protein
LHDATIIPQDACFLSEVRLLGLNITTATGIARSWYCGWPSLAFVFALGWLLAPAWWSGEIPAFRDTMHFFYPLWSFVEHNPAAERWLPTWNPWDGFGSSVVAEPTSMVFYPLRVVLLCPFGSLEQRLGIFLAVHFAIAYAGWLWCARCWRWSPLTAQWVAWGYTLSGPVFFTLYNPPFLVGAAWLPWAFGGCLKVCLFPKASWTACREAALLTGSALAMMVLGGDAQAAYHLVFIGGLLLVMLGLIRWWQQPAGGRVFYQTGRLVAVWGLMGFGVAGVTAVQIIPTCYWLRLSTRGSPPLASALDSQEGATVKQGGAASEERRSFHLHGWEALTLIAPNFFGSMVPEHTRWIQRIAPNDRMWIPSLHFGTALAGLMCAGWFTIGHCLFFRGRWTRQHQLLWIASAVALLAWLSGLEHGLFSLWSDCLPFYCFFRYPAKWSTFLVWGMCLAAGTQLEMLLAPKPSPTGPDAEKTGLLEPRCWRGLVLFHQGVVILGLCLLAFYAGLYGSPAFRGWIYAVFAMTPWDPWCGFLDMPRTIANLGRCGWGMLWVGGVGTIGFRKALSGTHRSFALAILAACSMLELFLAARAQTGWVAPHRLQQAVHQAVIDGDRLAKQQENSEPLTLAQSEESATIQRWTIGDRQTWIALPVNKPSEFPPKASPPMHQASGLLGKFHLLFPEASRASGGPAGLRSFRADFSLQPRLMTSLEQARETGYWRHRLEFLEPSTAKIESPASSRSDMRASQPTAKQVDDGLHIEQLRMEGPHLQFYLRTTRRLRLTLPILDDDGWRIVSQRAGLHKLSLAGELLVLAIEPGEYRLSLRYWPPGLSMGLIVSSMALVGGWWLVGGTRRAG